MTLDTGTTVITSADGGALLTFFEGSELQLEPNTTVEITQVSEAENHAIAITLTQLAGDTWSHVTKMIDQYSKYEIHTPSAVALVRGTRFMTHVDASGQTKVETSEGLVSVAGDGEEVYVPVGKKTIVKPGQTPTVPVALSVPDDDAPETPRTADLLGHQPPQGSLLGLEAPNDSDNGQGQANANGQSADKGNNGQGQANANGQSVDNGNNGQGQANANGQSEDKSNNGQGQANGNNGQGQGNVNGQDQTNGNNGQGQSNVNSQDQANNNGQGNNKQNDQSQASVNGTTPASENQTAPDAALTGDEIKGHIQGNGNK
jgi:hypothetical protein